MQKISTLTDEMSKDIEAKRDWVRNHYAPESLGEYDTIEGKLILLDTILKSNWIDKEEKVKWQSLGITLGDVFVQDMNFPGFRLKMNMGQIRLFNCPVPQLYFFP